MSGVCEQRRSADGRGRSGMHPSDSGAPRVSFSVLYADPPWQYGDKKPRGGAENHYPTMGRAELAKLRVGQLGDRNSVMFMWATWPLIIEACWVMQAWGYK